MRFIREFGYTVKIGKDEAHQAWVIKNDAALRAAMPKGTRYLGTFSVVLSTEKQAGSYRVLIEMDSYGAMDTLAAASKDPSNAYGRLVRDSSQFGDFDHAAGWSDTLMKDVNDATIWDPKS